MDGDDSPQRARCSWRSGSTRLGLLCINVDESSMDELMRTASALAGPPPQPRPSALFEQDWREQVASLMPAWLPRARRRHAVQAG